MMSDGIGSIADPDVSLDNLRQRIRNHALADETSVLDAFPLPTWTMPVPAGR